MIESKLQATVVRYLRTVPGLFFYKASDRYTCGIPDLIICYKRFIGIELKVGRNKLSKIQEYVKKKIEAAGGECYVCRSLDDVKKVIGGDLNCQK